MKPLVLVLEQDRGTRKLLEALFRRTDLEVDAVALSADALLLLERVEYDFVFTDPDVLAWLETNRPDVLERCAALSSPPALNHIATRWRVPTIPKPFELSEIVGLARGVAAVPARRKGSLAEDFARRSVVAGAKSGVVLSLDASGIAPVTSYGYAPGVVESFLPLRLDSPLPLTVAMRHARPVWIASSRSAGEFSEFVPLWEQFATAAIAVLPVMHDGVVLGAAGWAFREPQRFDEAQQAALQAIATSLSATLYESSVRSTA